MPEVIDHQPIPDGFTVGVLTCCRDTPDDPWQDQAWEVTGIVAGEQAGGDEATSRLVHETSDTRTYLSGGFRLELFADDAESYYHNLMADQPAAFVLCDRGEDGALLPRQVTLSYGEGTSYMEMEEAVYAVPLPPELYRWLERFVLEHYVPDSGT